MQTLKFMTVIICLLTSSVNLQAQEQKSHEHSKRGERRAKIEAQKVVFLTSRMELTTEEAQKFWPIYNEFKEKRKAIRESYKKGLKGKKLEELTESEMKKIVDDEVEMNIQMAQLDKEFNEAIKKVLPIKKVFLLHKAEREFKKEIMKKMRENRRGKPEEK